MTAPAGPPHYRAYRVVLAILVIATTALLFLWLLALMAGPALDLAVSPEEFY
jgi:hypothetical protein